MNAATRKPSLRDRMRWAWYNIKARFWPEASNLTEHAQTELEAGGWFGKDSAYDGMVGRAVMELQAVFAAQGHSGNSAKIVLALFQKVGDFQPIGPLTGADSEWHECSPGTFQNRRCHHVFKENGQAYDIDGRIFREPNGSCYTNRDSRVNVTFPYTPKREYVDMPASRVS